MLPPSNTASLSSKVIEPFEIAKYSCSPRKEHVKTCSWHPANASTQTNAKTNAINFFIAGRYIHIVADILAGFAALCSRLFYSLSERRKVVNWYGSFHCFYVPLCYNNSYPYIIQFIFFLGYDYTIHSVSHYNSNYSQKSH